MKFSKNNAAPKSSSLLLLSTIPLNANRWQKEPQKIRLRRQIFN